MSSMALWLSKSHVVSVRLLTAGTQLMQRILPASSSTEKNMQAVLGESALYCFMAASRV